MGAILHPQSRKALKHIHFTMKTFFPLIGLLGFLITLLVPLTTQANGWELVFEAENLVVQRRDYEGSNLKEIKGVTRMKASLNAVMALLKDAEFNHHWVYRSGGATILQEVGYAQAYVYGIVDAPWPMRDRDTVVRFDYQQDTVTKAITIAITNFPGLIATKNEFVRVPKFGGYWTLQPEKDGWVEVTYQVYGDPGGWIPVWVANHAAVISVKRTLHNMRSAVARYGSAQSKFVEEVDLPGESVTEAAIGSSFNPR
jgi:hypothetical protein